MGKPTIPEKVRALIRQLAWENHLWGEDRIANEGHLKMGIRVSHRTVRKYMPKDHRAGDAMFSVGPLSYSTMREPYWPVTSLLS